MKELVSALSLATVNRLNTPFLGSFILSVVFVNHDKLLLFFLADAKERIRILEEPNDWFLESWSNPFLMYGVYPAILALIYTFAIPLLQHILDHAKYELVDKKRLKQKHTRMANVFDSQGEVSRAQAKSSLEYWHSKLTRDLDDWSSKKLELEQEISSLKDDKKALRDKVSQQDKEIKELAEQKGELAQEMSQYVSVISERDKLVSKLNEKALTDNEMALELQSRYAELTAVLERYTDIAKDYDEVLHQINSLSEIRRDEAKMRNALRFHSSRQVQGLVAEIGPEFVSEVIGSLTQELEALAKRGERHRNDLTLVDTVGNFNKRPLSLFVDEDFVNSESSAPVDSEEYGAEQGEPS
ncbi:hypothetical protein C9980_12820 [Vibrio mediterranei]|uniref:hypothetical protein n=1 Tax=Vibrio mediterranei TaxID=689 RepID=UPI000D184728|nr:hypothetical protein [Vibrio mediterranei]PTC04334.1 hypothetical protein C9980_12820 [Vibrio mediterranei]